MACRRLDAPRAPTEFISSATKSPPAPRGAVRTRRRRGRSEADADRRPLVSLTYTAYNGTDAQLALASREISGDSSAAASSCRPMPDAGTSTGRSRARFCPNL